MNQIIKLFILLIFSVFTITSCKKDEKKIDVSEIKSNVKVIRFDQLFTASDSTTFPKLKADFPLFFPGEMKDHEWLAYKNDSLFQLLNKHIDSTFGNFKQQKSELDLLFKHVKYYYPSFKTPEITTLISLLDFDNQVIYTDNTIILSLDTFLGKDKPYYTDFPDYLRGYLEPSQIVIKVAEKIAEETTPKIINTLFIDKIIALGKIKYAMHQFLPKLTEAQIMNYTPEKFDWAKNNEFYIWQFFMEKNYLFDGDKDLDRRFIDPAPFSKFYIENDAESPGQIGIWTGLQIVKSYAANTNASLTQIMATSSEEIFKKSKYKPSK